MQHFLSALIVNGSLEGRLEKIRDLSAESKFQVATLDCQDKKGISDVRDFQKKSFFKPSFENKILLNILEMQHLSEESQTTLLKLIEEPLPNYQIQITADQTGSLLPTILSRCAVVDLGQNPVSFENGSGFFKQPLSKQFENLAEIDFDQVIHFLKNQARATCSQELIGLINLGFNTKRRARAANINSKLAKEHLLVKIDYWLNKENS